MTDFYEGPTYEIEKFLQAPFEVSPVNFLIGAVVLDTLLLIGLDWEKSFDGCKDTSQLCNKSLQVFENISYAAVSVFAILFFVHLVSYGVRKHGIKPMGFLPVVSFTVFINLFIWLFRDVFTVMIAGNINTDDDLTDILRKQFFMVSEQFNLVSFETPYSYVLLPILVLWGVQMGGKSFKN